MTTVHVTAAVTRLSRDGAIPRPVHDIPYAGLINQIADSHHLNPALVAAVSRRKAGSMPGPIAPRGVRAHAGDARHMAGARRGAGMRARGGSAHRPSVHG